MGGGLLLVLLVAGCGDGLPKRVPVAGKVTIDGKPVTAGSIRFKPASGGRVANGEIGPDGTFVMTTFTPGDGCTLDSHTVTVYAFEDIGESSRRWHIPKKYGREGASGLNITISGPTESLPIELTWGGVRGPITEKLD